MTDDPRDILRAAGVDTSGHEFRYLEKRHTTQSAIILDMQAEDIILALARLVAKYKWMAEHRWGWDFTGPDKLANRDADEVKWLDRRWEEHHADA